MKTSIEDLPIDDAETRLTKAFFRRVWARKSALRLTTAELAARFSEISGKETPPSTMNGIFAGKRKTATLYEVIVFAEALGCAPGELCPEVADMGEQKLIRDKVRRELIQELLSMS